MSFIRPTLSELIERARADVESRLPGADSRLRHSVLDVLVRTHAGGMGGLYGYLDFIARQILPDTAEAEYLARWAAIWGLQRKPAVAASGALRFTGTNGAAVPIGAELARIDGALYRTTAAAVIAGGEAIVAVEALEGGVEGDAAEGAQLTLTSAVAGVNATASVQAGGLSGGSAEEDDAALLDRLLQRIRNPPEGGAKSDYVRWALLLPEATRAWVFPGWMGPGTVGVTFALDGREDILPTPADIEAMEANLDPLRPVTAQVFVFALTETPIDMVIRVEPATADVQQAVRDELADMFTRDAEPGGTIRVSRIREAISQAAGEVYHDLQLPDRDLGVGPAEFPVLGEVTFI